MNTDGNTTSKKKKVIGILGKVLLLTGFMVLTTYVVPTYAAERTIVSGNSMESNFHNGENLLVNKLEYRIHAPKRFDVITFYPYGKQSDRDIIEYYKRLILRKKQKVKYYIKRIIGLPGETVQIIGEDIYINGEKLQENYGRVPITDAGVAAEPITLGEGEYFVLGDNREKSEDSRVFGVVKEENIAGKVALRLK